MDMLYRQHKMQGLSKEDFFRPTHTKILELDIHWYRRNYNVKSLKLALSFMPVNHPIRCWHRRCYISAPNWRSPTRLKVLANRGLGNFQKKFLTTLFSLTHWSCPNDPQKRTLSFTPMRSSNTFNRKALLLIFPAGKGSY